MTEATTIVELPASLRSALHRSVNKGLMVAWINRAGQWDCDVRSSYAFYDADGLFEQAVPKAVAPDGLTEAVLAYVFKKTNGKIRYWSKGI